MSDQHFNTKNTYSLLVGVGKRPGDNDAMSITAKDAEQLAGELVNSCQFLKQKVKCLYNDAATKEKFIVQLDELIADTEKTPANLVVIYFSGHGCQDNGKYYLVCHDTKDDDIENTGLEGVFFIKKLQAIQTDKMLVLLDCCHAGGFAKNAPIPFNEKEFLKKNTNRVILTASHAEQVSFVSQPLSLFTYALIEGLTGKYFKRGDTVVTIFDLAMYVRERVFPLSKSRQQPQLNVLENSLTSNFALAQYPAGKPTAAFPKAFNLLTETGDKIVTNKPIEKDNAYRKQFEWIKNRDGIVQIGTGNIAVKDVSNNSSVTISQNIKK